MTVEELIQKLKQYPLHYEVEIFSECPETGDKEASIENVVSFNATKTVSLEIGQFK